MQNLNKNSAFWRKILNLSKNFTLNLMQNLNKNSTFQHKILAKISPRKPIAGWILKCFSSKMRNHTSNFTQISSINLNSNSSKNSKLNSTQNPSTSNYNFRQSNAKCSALNDGVRANSTQNLHDIFEFFSDFKLKFFSFKIIKKDKK